MTLMIDDREIDEYEFDLKIVIFASGIEEASETASRLHELIFEEEDVILANRSEIRKVNGN